jgi:hypothetical protein
MNLKALFLGMIMVISLSLSASEFDPVLTEYFDRNPDTGTLDFDTITDLFEISVQNKRTIFELLNSLILYAKEKNINLVLPGDIIREVEKTYQLGGATVRALLPTHIIENIMINSDVKLPKLELSLQTEYNTTISFGEIHLDKRFGFKDAVKGKFLQSFGIQAGVSIFRFGIDVIDLFPGLEMGAQVLLFNLKMPVKEILRK